MLAGTVSTLISRVAGLSLAFFLTPLVIRSIGVEAYGLWAIAGAAVNYFALLDCGVDESFVKYLAEFLERREHHNVRQVMTFGFLFYVAFGLIVLPAVRLLGPHIVAYLRLNPRYMSAANDLLSLAVAYFVVSNALGIFGAFMAAMQRTELYGAIDGCYQIVYAISLIALLRYGYGVYALPYAIFCALGLTAIIRVAFVCRTFGNPWCSPFSFERALLKRVFKFGFWMQINGLTGLINLETDRIILGTFVSVTSAGYYQLGNKLAEIGRILPTALIAPLFPAAAALDGRQEDNRLNTVYVRGTRYFSLITFVLAGFLIGAGTPILRLWIGQRFPYVTVVMAALLVSYAINSLTGIGTMIVRATAQPYYETYYAVASAVINVLATLVLTPLFGLMGVVTGTVIGSVCGSLFFLWLFHKVRRLGWRSTLISWLWRLTLATAAASSALWCACRLIPSTWFASRTDGLFAITFLGITYLAVAAIWLWLLGFWTRQDLELIEELAPALTPWRLSRERTAEV